MPVHQLDKTNSIANRFVAELRDASIQQDSLRFRTNLERLGVVFAYEISKTLDYGTEQVQTPLGTAEILLPTDRIVIGSILRAGLPLHNGVLSVFDRAENAFVSAYRRHHKDGTFEIKVEYISCPDLTDCTLILCDPMLATGASLDQVLNHLLAHGTPSTIHLVTAIASDAGLSYVRREHHQAHIWVASIDAELTAKSYIVPGLGDAGDLAFGAKLQD